MKLKTITEKLRTSKPASQIRTCVESAGLSPFLRLCWENPFPVQCFLALVYRLVLDIVYLMQLSPVFEYSGFTTHLVPVKYFISWLILLVLLPLISGIHGQEDRPSSIMVTILNYLYFIPMTSYIGCKGSELWFVICVLLYWALFLLLQLCIPSLHLKKLPSRWVKTYLIPMLTIGSVLLVMGVSGFYTGFRLHLNFIDVYGMRAEAATYNIPSAIAYPLSWMSACLSLLMLYWLEKKKYLISALLFVVYLFYFSIDAVKSKFFFLFLAIGCYFLYRKWMYRWMPGLLPLVVIACACSSVFVPAYMPTSLFVRRLMYVPVFLSESYAIFFSQNPVDLFRSGVLGNFSYESLYSKQIPYVIGEFLNSPQTSCNNGMLGDMFANLPVVVGIVVMPLILILCFRLLDLVIHTTPQKIYFSFLIFFFNAFSNASWSVVLLTHGFLFACFLLYLFPEKELPTS